METKKMLTKALSVFLVVVMTLTAAPLSGFVGFELPEWLDISIKSSAATSGTCGENLTWTYDSSTYTLTISGTGDMKNYSTDYMGTTTNRPWEYYCEEIRNVVISSGVTSIGNYAFRKFSSITNITIPSSVTSIGNYAFYGCHSLSNITIPDNVTTIAEGVFYYCTSLTKIIIPDSITSIGESSFRCCTSIKSVTISDNVSSIGDLAFFCCSNLKDIYYSGTEEQWENISKGYNNDPLLNAAIHYNSIVGTCGDNLIWTFDESTGTLTISGTGAMDDFSSSNRPWEDYEDSIKEVVVSNGVTSIGDYACYGCDSLTNITFSNSVTTIGDSAFRSCGRLTGIIIPNGVTTIKSNAFYRCTNLANITIPNSVTTIKSYAFYECKSLTNITIPDRITVVEMYTFGYCDNLTSVTIPNIVTTIGPSAFYSCDNIKDVYYSGTESAWNEITIGTGNYWMTDATIHYNSTGPDSGDSELPVYPDSTVIGTLESLVHIVGPNEWTTQITVEGKKYLLKSEYAEQIDLLNNDDKYLNKRIIFIIKNNEVIFLDTVSNVQSGNSTLKAYLDTGLYAVPIQYTNGKFASKKVNVSGFIKNALSRSDVDVSVFSSLGSFGLENVKVTLESSDKNILYFKKNVLSAKSNTISFDYGSTISPGTFEPFIQQAYLNTNWEFPEGSKNYSIDITCTVTGTINGKTVSDSFKNTITFTNNDYTTPKTWETQSLTDLIKEMQKEVKKSDLTSSEQLEVELILISILQSQQLTDLDADLDAFNTVYKLGCYAYGIKSPSIEDAGEKILDLIVAKCDKASSDLKNDMEDLFSSLCNSKTFNKFAYSYYNKYQVQIGNMKQVNAHCPIDISVVDEDGLQVLSIVNDEIVLANEGTVAFVCDSKKTIYLPTDIDHVITITATGTGTMDYSVTERNSDNELRTVEYDDITLTKGKTFTGDVSKVLLPSADEYNLSANTGEKIEYDSVSVEDVDTELEVVLSNISVYSNPTKTTYTVGESLNTSGLKLKLTYSDGSTEIVSTGYTVSGFDSTTAGTKTVTVTYGGKSTTFTVTVTKPTTYTLSYNANGGSGAPTDQTGSTSYTISSTVPTKFGYTFLGWSKSSSSSTATYIPNNTIEISANTTLYAVWQSATTMSADTTYSTTIGFSNQEHYYTFTPSETTTYVLESSGSLDSRLYVYNSSGTQIGYDDDSGNGSNFKLLVNLSSKAKYYVKVRGFDVKTGTTSFNVKKSDEIISYTIKYNANGGSGAPANQIKTYDVSLTLSTTTPTRTGYTFLGWSTSSTATSATYHSGGTFTSNKDTTLYAVWKANTYTVKYNANGGSGTMSNSSHTYDKSTALNFNTFTRTGYTFLGWSTSSDATTATYNDNQFVKNLTTTKGETVNLYAIWEANTYSVRYNANGGSGSMENSSHTYDVSKALTPNAFTRSGYIFLGWSTSSDAKTPTYKDNQSVKNLSSTKGGTIYLYAIWERLPGGSCGSNVTWIFYESTGTLTFLGSGSMTNYSSSNRPWESYEDSIKEVVIEEGVTTIGNYAFYDCDSLTSVMIPNSVTSIGEYVFSNCDSLAGVAIGDSVTLIGDRAFTYCDSLMSIDVSENNKAYSSKEGVLFNKNKTMIICYPASKTATSYAIPNSVKTIGEFAFYDCVALTSVTIPDSVIIIDDYAFQHCRSLTSVTIPDSVTSIGNYAFDWCISLKSVTISDSITSIGNSTFRLCTSLTSVTIGAGLKTIGHDAFLYCNSLTSFDVSEKNKVYSSKDGVLFNKNKTTLIKYPEGRTSTSYTIPDSVTSIGVCAFEDCTSLVSVTIPDSVTSIDSSAFYKCTGLTDVYYAGTEEQWSAISIGSSNTYLTNATIHYNSTGEHSHSYIPIVTPPTCTIQGYTKYTCDCGDTYIDDYVNATGHYFVNGKCTNCSEPDPNIPEEPEYIYTFSIQNPSRTEIRNKDGIILHANIEGNVPDGSYVRWESNNGNFDEKVDGNNLEIIAENKGYTTFTAILCDADGNELARDTVEMYSKSGFFDKIGGFFRSLFGGTKIYEN